MGIFHKAALIAGCLVLAACTEQPVNKNPAQPVANKPAAVKPAHSNVEISAAPHPNSSADDSYYVQNRVLASGGALSGAMMGS